MSFFSLYLVSILDNLRAFLFIGIVISVITLIIGMNYVSDEKTSKEDGAWGVAKLGFFLLVFFGFFLIITPTTKDAVAVIAGHTILEIAGSDRANSVVTKSAQVLDNFLDKQLEKENEK